MDTPVANKPVRSEPPVSSRRERPRSPGEALLERYRLDREVARTETGVLYDAAEEGTGRGVSVEIANDLGDDARERFERDAMLAQRLEGEHVVRVLDAGVLLDGTPYVVRERTLGSLADDVAGRGLLPTAEAVAWTLETCEALAEAHARGMSHGDIRPETVHLGRDPRGNPIVKVQWTSKAKAERAAREDVARDIAGAAVVLRFLLTGRADDDDGAKTLPSDIAHAIARALSPDPDARFRNVGELAAAIEGHAPPGHKSARNVMLRLSRAGIVGSGRLEPHPAPPLNESWFEPRPSVVSERRRRARRRTGTFAATALLVLAAALAAVVLLWRSGMLSMDGGAEPSTAVDAPESEQVSRTTLTAAEIADTTAMTAPGALVVEEGRVEDDASEPAAPPPEEPETNVR